MSQAARAGGLPRWHPAWWVATVAGIGFLPMAPGTWGSLVALPVGFAVSRHYPSLWLAPLAVLVFLLGWWASAVYVARTGKDDPGEVVIDEVAGQLLTLALVPAHWFTYAAGFLVFRVLDIAKPFPASWCDREIPGGLGVMADDMVSGLYGMIVMGIAVYLGGTLQF